MADTVISSRFDSAVKLEAQAVLENRWFRSQVEAANKEADDPATKFVDHETIRSDWADKKKALKERAGKRSHLEWLAAHRGRVG